MLSLVIAMLIGYKLLKKFDLSSSMMEYVEIKIQSTGNFRISKNIENVATEIPKIRDLSDHKEA